MFTLNDVLLHRSRLMGEIGRRELRTRRKQWPRLLAEKLARLGVTPNAVSITSIVFALVTAVLWSPLLRVSLPVKSALFVLGSLGIQLRLLCNLIDGLIAIEGGQKSPVGDIYNDAPDRLSDALVFVAAGYLSYDPALGWLAALLAVGTAYVRTLGTALTAVSDYRGPMAKQQRMFILTVGGLGSAWEIFSGSTWIMTIVLVIVCLGSIVTIIRRLRHISKLLWSQSTR